MPSHWMKRPDDEVLYPMIAKDERSFDQFLRTISTTSEPVMLPQGDSRPDFESGFKDVYTRHRICGSLVNTGERSSLSRAPYERVRLPTVETKIALAAPAAFFGRELTDVTVKEEINSAEEWIHDLDYLHGSTWQHFNVGATSTERLILPGEGKKKRRLEEIELLMELMEEGSRAVVGEPWDYISQEFTEKICGYIRRSTACEDHWGTPNLKNRWDQGPKCLKETERDDHGSSEDEGSATHESHTGEVTAGSSCYKTNSNHNGRKRKSVEDSDDLIARLLPLIKIQVADALNSTLLPLVAALRTREEHEQSHREQILALEKEKLALKRQR